MPPYLLGVHVELLPPHGDVLVPLGGFAVRGNNEHTVTGRGIRPSAAGPTASPEEERTLPRAPHHGGHSPGQVTRPLPASGTFSGES